MVDTPGITESSESINKSKKEKTFSDLYREYVKYKLQKKDWKTEFINNIMGSDSIDWELLKDIERFAWEDETWAYDNMNISSSNLNIWALKREVRLSYLLLDNKRKDVKKNITGNYDITDTLYSSKVDNEVNKLKESDLNFILENKKYRENFLKKCFSWTSIPKERDLLDFLNNSEFKSILKEKLNRKLDSYKTNLDSDKTNLEADLINLEADLINLSEGHYSKDNINSFLKLDVLDDKEKKELLHTFIPYINLKKAIDYWLVDDNYIIDYKKQIVKNSKESEWLGDDEITLIASELKNESIYISTKNLRFSSSSKDKLDDIISSGMFEAINSCIQEKKEKIKNEAPKNLLEFKLSLKNIDKIKNKTKWIDEISEWSLLEIEISNEWTSEFYALKIISVDNDLSDWEKWISFKQYKRDTWENEYTLSHDSILKSYHDFKYTFEEDNLIEVVVSSASELDKKIKNKEIELNDKDILKLQSSENIDRIESEIVNKKEKLEKLREQWKDEESYILEQEINSLEQKLNFNVDELNRKINELDSSWEKYGLEKWTSFSFDLETPWIPVLLTIEKIDNEFVTLDNNEKIDLQSFYLWFKELKAKRFWKITGEDSFLDDLWNEDKIWEDWKKYEIENWLIKHNKNKDKVDYKEIEYLMSDSSEKCIKINSIDWNNANINFSEVEWKKWEEKVYCQPSQTITLAKLNYFIKKWKLVPIDGYESPEEENDDIKRKSNFLSWIFQSKSLAEIIKWWTIWLEAIKNMLEEWNQSHASKAALGLFGWMWWELKYNLKSRVQADERKSQDEQVTRLKDLDSWEATALIETWLSNKSCPDYKVNAALVFMYQEYGSLYTKEKGKDWKIYWLSRYRWTNFWYKALWWTPWDATWNSAKENCKDEDGNDMPFTEEFAVYYLVNKQCLEWRRQSRLHKEIKGVWSNAIQEEVDKWYKDASDTRTIDWINWGWLSELKEWTYANFVWWCKKASERGSGHMHKVYKMPAVAIFSWVINNFDQRIITKHMKDMYNWTDNPMILFDFVSSVGQMDFLSDVILELSKKIGWEESDMFKEAEKIYNDRYKTWKGREEIKIKETEKFWDKYWESLTRALHMLNNDSKWDWSNSKIDNTVFLEAHKVPPNTTLKKYYDHMRNSVSWSFDFTNKSYMNDWLKWAWITWLNTKKAITKWLEYSNSSFRKKEWDIYKTIWGEVVASIDAVKLSWDLSLEEKKSILMSKYKDLLSWVYQATSSSERGIDHILNKDDTTSPDLKRFWLAWIDNKFNSSIYGYKTIESSSPWDPIYSFLEKAIEDYLNNVWSNSTQENVFDILSKGNNK